MSSGERSSRAVVVVGAGVALFIAALSWFVVVSPLRSAVQTQRVDTAAVQTQNAALQSTAASLKDDAKRRPELEKAAVAALAGLPPGPRLPGFNRQLSRQAAGRNVVVTSISVGAASTPALPAATDGAAAAPAAGALAIPVTIQSTGSVNDQLLFLRDIQQVGPRLALVTSTAFGPGVDAADVGAASTMTLQITVFSAPLAGAGRAQLAALLTNSQSG